jgi:hypothetical protein
LLTPPPLPPPPRYNLSIASKLWCVYALDDALWHYPDLWQPSMQLQHLQAEVTSAAYPIQPEQAALPAPPAVKKEREREKEKEVRSERETRSSQKNGQRALMKIAGPVVKKEKGADSAA